MGPAGHASRADVRALPAPSGAYAPAQPGAAAASHLLAGLLGSMVFFFSSAKYIGVTEAIAISFIAPLVVTFLAWPLLGERITFLRLASVVIGFVGVVIVIRPGSSCSNGRR